MIVMGTGTIARNRAIGTMMVIDIMGEATGGATAIMIAAIAASRAGGVTAKKKAGIKAIAICLLVWPRRTRIAASRGMIMTETGTEIGIETE